MEANVDLFWSFRSPYSYLATFFGEDRIDTLRWCLAKRGLRRG
jgi:2-hydroxychromene-2-carboxylate isomerase